MPEFKLIPLAIPPGLVRDGTTFESKTRWRDGNLVRWRNGFACPVGGWKKVAANISGVLQDALEGTASAAISWRATDQVAWFAIGSTRKLYASDQGAFYDITPSGFVEGNDYGSAGLGYGAYIYGDDPLTVNTPDSNAPPTNTNDKYGTPRSFTTITNDPGTWSLDTWGQNLIGCMTSDGELYEWEPGDPAALTISGAPVDNRAVIVTQQRHVMALGSGGNPRRVAWCAQENNTDWTPSISNDAGDFDLETNGLIQGAVHWRDEILVFTNQDMHRVYYVGGNSVFGRQRVAEDCGVISAKAMVATPDRVFWWSQRGFFEFDGYAKPLPSTLDQFLAQDLNRDQAGKIGAGHNELFNEVWFFYPSVGSSTGDCDSYVLYNYVERTWSSGRLRRSCWVDASVVKYPLAMESYFDDALGETMFKVYEHENGWDNNGVARGADLYLESGPLEIGQGDQFMKVRRFMQDTNGAIPQGPFESSTLQGRARVSFFVSNAPNRTPVEYGPYDLDDERGYTDVRFSGRQVSIRIAENPNVTPGEWRIGTFRIAVKPGETR